MKNLLLFSFVAILLMGCDENSENLPAPNYTIEGKWLHRRRLFLLETRCISMKMVCVTPTIV